MRMSSNAFFVALMAVVAVLCIAPGLALADEASVAGQRVSVDASDTPQSATSDVQMLIASDAGAQSEMEAQKDVIWTRLYGQEALDTMERIVNTGWKGETGGTVVLATDAGYWDALTAAGAAGFADAPVLMTAPKSLSPQAARLLKAMKPKHIIICGGEAVISKAAEQAAAKAANGADVRRFWGQTMTDTADDIFKHAASYSGGAWSRTAFVATSNGYWDALAAAPISYRKHMPIFLTETRDKLSNATIKAMKGRVDRVVIVGGKLVVSEAVERQLKAAGIEVDRRLGGQTAIDTSVLVAKYGVSLGMVADNMGVATQNGYWDALAGAAFCGKKNSVLVLVDKRANSSSINGFIMPNAKNMRAGYIFGGRYAVSNSIGDRLSGDTYPEDSHDYSHVHRWESETQTIWHIKTEPVVDVPAWDEPIYEYHIFCMSCNADLTATGEDIGKHLTTNCPKGGGVSVFGRNVQVDSIHHDVVMHDEIKTWYETVDGGCRCSSCDAIPVVDPTLADDPAHTHIWAADTIQVPKTTSVTVTDFEEYYEPVYGESHDECTGCGSDLTVLYNEAGIGFYQHVEGCPKGGAGVDRFPVLTGYIHHDAETHTEVSNFDETVVTGYHCALCGVTK